MSQYVVTVFAVSLGYLEGASGEVLETAPRGKVCRVVFELFEGDPVQRSLSLGGFNVTANKGSREINGVVHDAESVSVQTNEVPCLHHSI